MTDRLNYKSTPFTIIMATLALMLLGVAMVPLLKVKEEPDRNLPLVYCRNKFLTDSIYHIFISKKELDTLPG